MQIQQSHYNLYEQTSISFLKLEGKSNPYEFNPPDIIEVKNLVKGVMAAVLSTNALFLIVVIATFAILASTAMYNIITWGYKKGVTKLQSKYVPKDNKVMASKVNVRRQRIKAQRERKKQRAHA